MAAPRHSRSMPQMPRRRVQPGALPALPQPPPSRYTKLRTLEDKLRGGADIWSVELPDVPARARPVLPPANLPELLRTRELLGEEEVSISDEHKRWKILQARTAIEQWEAGFMTEQSSFMVKCSTRSPLRRDISCRDGTHRDTL